MKTKQLSLIILIFICGSVISQTSLKIGSTKNRALNSVGSTIEGHDLKFSTKLFKHKNQFIQVEAGAGIFYPSELINQTVSSGFTFNKGINNHFFSIGLHLTYATDEPLDLQHLLSQTSHQQSPLIGYQYSTNQFDFKFHIQPISGSTRSKTGLLPTTSIGLNCHF